MRCFLYSLESAPKTASRSVHPFCTSYFVCPTRRLVTLRDGERIRPMLTPIVHSSFDQHESAPKRNLDRFSRFFRAYSLNQTCKILCFTMLKSGTDNPKMPLSVGDYRPHLTHGSLGPPESRTQTASRSVQASFARLTNVTNRQTHRPRYSVCRMGHIIFTECMA